MVSILDAVFIAPAAVFVIAFIIPPLLLLPQASTDFRQVTSHEIAPMIVQSWAMAFLSKEDDEGRTNYRRLSFQMSNHPSPPNIDNDLLLDHPTMLGWIQIKDNDGYVDEEPRGSSPDLNRPRNHYRVMIPTRGADIKQLNFNFQVK